MSEPPGGSQPGKTSSKQTISGRPLRTGNTASANKQRSSRVNDAETGLKWLTENQILSSNQPDIPTLVTALHDLAMMAGIPDQYRDGIHAFAYVIFSTYEGINQSKHEENLKSIKEFISAELTEMKEAVTSEVTTVKTQLQRDLASSISKLKQSDQGCNALPNTYAQVLLSQARPKPTQQNLRLAERCEKSARLLTLKPAQGLEHDPTKDLTNTEILAKARIALDQMDTASCPVTPKFLSVHKAKSNAITYELNDMRAVQWLSQSQHREAFLQGFGGTMDIRPKFFTVIAELTPVSFNTAEPAETRLVESENELPEDSIQRVSWIKPIQRRRPGQRTAHLLLDFNEPDTANLAIQQGIVIQGARVQVRKKQVEPLRCLKCQVVPSNHLAAHCRQLHDQCAQCRGFHRTAQCPVTDSLQYYCANCKVTGHAAWDRNCPVYLKAVSQINARTPENDLRYFPMQDQPNSWEHNDGRIEAPILDLLRNPTPKSATRSDPPQSPHEPAPEERDINDGIDSPLYFPPSSVETGANPDPPTDNNSSDGLHSGHQRRQSRLDEYWPDNTQPTVRYD